MAPITSRPLGGLLAAVNIPIRRDLDTARLAARERRLRLVMHILRGRKAERARTRVTRPAGRAGRFAGGRQLSQR
jgi:hypothetical protein